LVGNLRGPALFFVTTFFFFAFGFAAGFAIVLIGANLLVLVLGFTFFEATFFLLLPFAATTFFPDFFGDCFLGARDTGKMSPLVFDLLI
jgi:hypothetical protein